MKPTKLTTLPWIEPNKSRGDLIFPTDIGLLSKKQCAKLLNLKPATFYERYRRCNGCLNTMNKKLFKPKKVFTGKSEN